MEKITFRHKAQPPVSVYGKILNCDVEFDAPENMVILAGGILNETLPTANGVKLAQLKPRLERMLASYNLQRDLGVRVKHKVTEMMKSQKPTLSLVATELGMSERTLKRYLKESGTNFRAILDDIKKELCANYIKEGYSYSEIAELLWYCDQSAFTRAYKRWHGASPSKIKSRAQV